MGGRGRLFQRSGGTKEGILVRDPAHHRAGLLDAPAHLCDDLRPRQAARLHALCGRAAALLPREVEVAVSSVIPPSGAGLSHMADKLDEVGIFPSGALDFALHGRLVWVAANDVEGESSQD